MQRFSKALNLNRDPTKRKILFDNLIYSDLSSVHNRQFSWTCWLFLVGNVEGCGNYWPNLGEIYRGYCSRGFYSVYATKQKRLRSTVLLFNITKTNMYQTERFYFIDKIMIICTQTLTNYYNNLIQDYDTYKLLQ